MYSYDLLSTTFVFIIRHCTTYKHILQKQVYIADIDKTEVPNRTCITENSNLF